MQNNELEKKLRVAIIGATGYTGFELMRLLARHPNVIISTVTSRDAGQPVADMFPGLRGIVDLSFISPQDLKFSELDAVFFATPNGIAMELAGAMLSKNIRVIDLSADFRLKNVAEWEKWYRMMHAAPKLIDEAVYGLPEVNREQIKGARIVANPGCYPTAVQLGFIPLLEQGIIDARHLIADVKSGVSGAGRKAEIASLLAECSESMKAYGVSGHRHLPEIRQGLQQTSEGDIGLTFVPHLTPMIRGIHATLYGRLVKTDADIQSVFEQRYKDEPFVDVMPANSHPETRSVRGSNICRISIHRPQNDDTVVVLSVIDNLVKGAAGQAVQNFNIMHGLDETTGLDIVPLML